jgi:magnesium-transporting ATPase (P-type)
VIAIVTSTGANTSKGKLVKDILFPSPISFVFDEHLKLVVPILILWGFIMLILSAVILG